MKTPNETLAAVQRHIQKYNSPSGGSCVASGIEMILKLEGAVPESFYELQDKYQYENTGWGPFVTDAIHGFRFGSKRPSAKNGEVMREIAAELHAGRYVLVSLPFPGGCHIFVAFAELLGEIYLVSKFSAPPLPPEPLRLNCQTQLSQFLPFVADLDILTYKTA